MNKAPFSVVLVLPVSEVANAVIPFPMSEDDYDLLMATLALWKPALIIKSGQPLRITPIARGEKCRQHSRFLK